ncbi:MAG: ADP-L-glycero-D-manno-heptose-6-epimerase [Flavobacteriaceae bacterium]|nr:ADP-L-glycero-D-manno-heptose-6-epimerase [Flavobacteriaceae bacterium]
MKILVTGGAGYIGSNLIKYLDKNTSATITSLDNYFTGSQTNHIKGVNYIQGNTWDIQNLEKQDVVYHFGEYSRVVPSFKDIEYLTASNLWGSSRVIEQCKNWDSKLIYSASSSKFGGNENLSPYSWVKAKIVELIKNYAEWYKLKYEICYFYNVYGENHITEGDYATVIGIFEEQYKKNKPLTVVGDGKQSRQFTHINDIVNALNKIEKQNKNKEWYLSSDVEYKIIEVAKMFSDNIKMIPERKGERYKAIAIENDTKEILKWKIKHNLKDYINGQK